jgi:hypothetical protein
LDLEIGYVSLVAYLIKYINRKVNANKRGKYRWENISNKGRRKMEREPRGTEIYSPLPNTHPSLGSTLSLRT